jgi:hypothetical protein
MTKTIHGKVQGRTIELDEDLGVPDGEEVEVTVTLSRTKPPWGDGIKRSAGAGASIAEFDAVFEQIERDRKAAVFRESEQ